MKILDVCEFYSSHGGGVRSYIDRKFSAAQRCGAQLVVIAPGPVDRTETRSGGCIHWLRSPHERFDRRYFRFDAAAPVHALIDRELPDIIEISSPWRGASIALSYPSAVPRSFIFHMDPVAVYPETFLAPPLGLHVIDALSAPLWRRLRRINAASAITIVASHTVTRRLAAHGFARLEPVPLGIETALFAQARPDAALRAQMLAACGFADPRTPLLIAVSRHHPEKRLGVLIDAVARLNRIRPAGLVIVGAGPWEQPVRRAAQQVPQVHVAGALNDRPQLAAMLASSDAFLHGGAAETYGIAVAEALCAGLPVIVPDRGGAADFGRGAHAMCYPAGDAAACAAAVGRLLAGPDRAFRRAAARAAAAQLLTPDEHMERLLACYRRLLPFSPRLSNDHNLATMPPC